MKNLGGVVCEISKNRVLETDRLNKTNCTLHKHKYYNYLGEWGLAVINLGGGGGECEAWKISQSRPFGRG
jgi:hypothetical protein